MAKKKNPTPETHELPTFEDFVDAGVELALAAPDGGNFTATLSPEFAAYLGPRIGVKEFADTRICFDFGTAIVSVDPDQTVAFVIAR